MEPKTIEEAMEQLKKVEKDVLVLVTQVDEFMAWWDWARSSLNNMQRQDGTNRRRVLDIRSLWEKILAQYRKNTDRVSPYLHTHPFLRLLTFKDHRSMRFDHGSYC